MADVFISYSRSDKARVAPIVAALEAQGWSVWWDPAIVPGQQFDRMIADELERARAVLVVWTPDSVESRWVRGEAREGADRGILVPVQLGPARLPIDFRAYHTTDLGPSGNVVANPLFGEAVRAVENLLGRAAAPTAASHTPHPTESATSAVPARISICVLPFANLSGDAEQQYFSDGITADLITELSRWRLLAVRSRSASFKYRGSAVDSAQVARELNVRFIVEGTVRRMGDRVRIGVQLIDAETGNHVWGERFDRAQAEIFSVQDEVVQTIVGTLVGRVHVSDAERARRKPPACLDAYECVLEGNALFWDDPAGAAEATRLFERAIELDPGYGLAHSLLATLKRQKWRDDDRGDSSAPDRPLLRPALVLAAMGSHLHGARALRGCTEAAGTPPGSQVLHRSIQGRMPCANRRHGKCPGQRCRVPVTEAGILCATLDVEGTVQAGSRRSTAGRVDAPRRLAGLTACPGQLTNHDGCQRSFRPPRSSHGKQ